MEGAARHHYLKPVRINPTPDLGTRTFYADRASNSAPNQRDVVEGVRKGEYDPVAVSRMTLHEMEEDGSLPRDSVRNFWSSPGYSHCCFTAQGDLNKQLSSKITQADVFMYYSDSLGKISLDAEGEGCNTFLPGITEGWETLEMVAVEQGLID